MSRTPALDFLPGAAPQKSSALKCVEILGGNDLRTECLILGGLEVLLVARPAGTGGRGDIYCVHSCGHGTLAKFVLLDLTGSGHERDTIAWSVQDLLHRYTDETRPARLLELLNRQYHELALPSAVATAISAAYEPRRGEFRFANAGQPRPFHWSAAERRWSIVLPAEASVCGLPLGVKAAACYTEESLVLGAGDILFLTSDGLSKTGDRLGEFLEPGGVLKLLEESTAENGPGSTLVKPVAAFLRRFEEFHGGKKFEDDITLLWARCLPANGTPGALPDWT